jgi:SAM-dependent methyltransferase
MTTDARGQVRDIQDFWHRRGQTEAIVRHDGRPRATDFREHPVWLGVIPLLLADAQRPIRRVADMGSGTGIVAELLARLGYQVIAIEFAESRAAIARQRLAPYADAEVRVGDAMAPPLAVGEVDAIISRNLVWMLPRPDATVAVWRDLVGAGGRVAAIDATWRLERTWGQSLRIRLGLGRQDGHAPTAGPAPVSLANPTPLANTPDAGRAAAIWSAADLQNVRPIDLGWVGAVRWHRASALKRALHRSHYYAVVGDSR